MISKKRKATFVLVIPRFEDIFHSYYAGEIIHGVSLSISRLNADLLIHITDRNSHRGWLDSTLLDRKYIDGIIFADIDNDLNIVKRAIRIGMPCMVLNNIIDEPINYVAVDNRMAAGRVIEKLIQIGHSKIATIAGDTTTQAGLMRLEGYKDTMAKHGLEVPRAYITFGDFLRTPARQAAQKLLRVKDRPTAIFAASDVMALELLDVAKSMHIRIPDELYIIGFDNNPLGLTSSIKLSTVAQPLLEMGRLGAEQLGQMTQGRLKLPSKTILPTQLIIRETTATLKK